MLEMKKKPPSVALIWMYQGKNAAARREEIERFDYPNLTVVGGIQDVPAETDLCVFWMDDDQPVTENFINEMTKPLIAGEDFRALIHFWSASAMSLPKKLLDATSLGNAQGSVNPLLQLLLPGADGAKATHGRMHSSLSSIEMLALLSMEPVGFPS